MPKKLAIKKIFILIVLIGVGIVNNAVAANLAVPKELIALNTAAGEKIFLRSMDKQAYWPLSIEFVTQANLTYCAIASSVMVLNALGVSAPLDPIYRPYRIFTQNNFFTAQVQKIIQPAQVKRQGVTLEQLGDALASFSVNVKVVHANATTLSKFRELAKKAVTRPNSYIIVNFARQGINEDGAGHMSPLAAYDKITDRFLLLDVARYKYPPVWVTTTALWNAMHTFDQSVKAYRGFVIISKT